MDLSGAIVAVTGASRGIGRAVATALARRGAIVIGSALHAADDCTALDVRDASAVRRWIGGIVQEHGRIDLVVHCAGRAEQPQPLADLRESEFADIIATNLTGTFHVLQAAVSAMPIGLIIVVASRAARTAHPQLPAYSASKFGVLGLCQSLAKDLAESNADLSCLTVSPGGVDTQMRQELFGDASSQQSPDQVASIIVDLAEGTLVAPNGADIVIRDGKATVMPL